MNPLPRSGRFRPAFAVLSLLLAASAGCAKSSQSKVAGADTVPVAAHRPPIDAKDADQLLAEIGLVGVVFCR